MKILNIGDKAPGFTVVSTDKQMVSLSDFAGKNVVLLFFPFAFTGTCTKELCMIKDDITRYSSLNVQIIAISVDSPHSLKKYKEELQLPYVVLSDFNKSISNAYGCLYEEFCLGLKGVSKRSAFVINSESIIKHEEILENAGDIPNFDLINQTLASLN